MKSSLFVEVFQKPEFVSFFQQGPDDTPVVIQDLVVIGPDTGASGPDQLNVTGVGMETIRDG